MTVLRYFVRTVLVSTIINPGVKPGPMLFKIQIAN